MAAAAAKTATKTTTPTMNPTVVLGLAGGGGMITAATPTPVSPPPESAAPKPPAFESTFPSARLLDEKTGTKRKANTKTMTPNFADRLIFIVSPQEMEYLPARSPQLCRAYIITKIGVFCQTAVEDFNRIGHRAWSVESNGESV